MAVAALTASSLGFTPAESFVPSDFSLGSFALSPPPLCIDSFEPICLQDIKQTLTTYNKRFGVDVLFGDEALQNRHVKKIEVPEDTTLISKGDYHGQMECLVQDLCGWVLAGYIEALALKFIISSKYRGKIKFIFHGDYIDQKEGRKDFSWTVLKTLLQFKLDNPADVILLRGNHENVTISEYYHQGDDNFYKDPEFRQEIEKIFKSLPIMLIVGCQNESAGLTHASVNLDLDLYKLINSQKLEDTDFVPIDKKCSLSDRIKKNLLPPNIDEKNPDEILLLEINLQLYIVDPYPDQKERLNILLPGLTIENKSKAEQILAAIKIYKVLKQFKTDIENGRGKDPDGNPLDSENIYWGDIGDIPNCFNTIRGTGLILNPETISDYFRMVSGDKTIKALITGHRHIRMNFSGIIHTLSIADPSRNLSLILKTKRTVAEWERTEYSATDGSKSATTTLMDKAPIDAKFV